MSNKEIVLQVVQAFNQGNVEKLEYLLAEDVVFIWPGSFQIGPGKEAVTKFFEDCPEIIDFNMGHILEAKHQVVASGEATTKYENGSVRKSFFCDIYTKENQKVKILESYVVFEHLKK